MCSDALYISGMAQGRDRHGNDDHFEEDNVPLRRRHAGTQLVPATIGGKMNLASNRARPPQAATLLRLYIADETTAAEQALLNVRNLCEYHVEDRYELETVDILRQPLRAIREGVLVTPALLRLTPLPVRKIVGDLSDCKAVLHALGLSDKATNDKL